MNRPGPPEIDGCPFDPTDAEQLRDPWPWLHQAHESRPVFWMADREAWCITRHADAEMVLRDHRRFSSAKVIKLKDVPEEFAAALPPGDEIDRVLVSLDPPHHNRLRRLAQQAFRQHLIDEREAEVRALCDALIDAFVDDGHVDFVPAFAERLPVQAIVSMVGAPLDRAEDFRQWSMDRITMLSGAPGLDAVQRKRMLGRALEFNGWLHDLVEARRVDPRDDLTTWLVQAEEEGEADLTTSEVISLISTILSAGSSTTAHLLPLLVRDLAGDAALWARLDEDRSLIPTAVEEVLRRDTPIHLVIRTANEDVEVGGQRIAAGEDLFIHYAATQRDPAAFDRPDEIDIDRSDLRRHYAFGRGIHLCLGAPLARLEARVTVEALLDRLSGLRVVDQDERWIANPLTPGLAALPIEWSPDA